MKSLVVVVVTVVLAFVATAHSVRCSWQFLSRPDINAPTFNITHNLPSLQADGLLFIAPFSGAGDQDEEAEPHQPGAYIYHPQTGQLVWTAFSQYFAGWTVNLQPTKVEGRDVLLAFEGKHNAARGHGHGHLTVLDSSYEHLNTVRAGHHRFIDKHEGQLINDGKSALVQIYHPVPLFNLSRLAGAADDDGEVKREWVVDARFHEIDVATGNVLFEWSSLDHVPVAHSNISLASGQAGDGTSSHQAWDYFHINSVDKDAKGDYLISARDVNSVYKIDGSTGKIIWALGGRNRFNKDFVHLDAQVAFSYQHHARFQGYDEKGRELISLYDNSGHGTETDGGSVFKDAKTSSGKILALDTRTGKRGQWTAQTVQAFYPPFEILSKSQGSTHVLPSSKNVLVNWGSQGAATEFTENGTVVWHAFFAQGRFAEHDRVQNYRAFKAKWKGTPKEEAAVVGLAYKETANGHLTPFYASSSSAHTVKLILAASWNGDTEVHEWTFNGKTETGEKVVLEKVERNGFETSTVVDVQAGKPIEKVQAIGTDRDGKVLTTTRWEAVELDRPVPPSFAVVKSPSFVIQSV